MVKKIGILLVILMVMLVGCGREESASDTQMRNGLLYIINESKPFTGKLVDYYDNDQLKLVKHFKNGEAHGEVESYYSNGQLEVKGTYKHGICDGVRVEYAPNGEILLDLEYKNGKLIKGPKWLME